MSSCWKRDQIENLRAVNALTHDNEFVTRHSEYFRSATRFIPDHFIVWSYIHSSTTLIGNCYIKHYMHNTYSTCICIRRHRFLKLQSEEKLTDLEKPSWEPSRDMKQSYHIYKILSVSYSYFMHTIHNKSFYLRYANNWLIRPVCSICVSTDF